LGKADSIGVERQRQSAARRVGAEKVMPLKKFTRNMDVAQN